MIGMRNITILPLALLGCASCAWAAALPTGTMVIAQADQSGQQPPASDTPSNSPVPPSAPNDPGSPDKAVAPKLSAPSETKTPNSSQGLPDASGSLSPPVSPDYNGPLRSPGVPNIPPAQRGAGSLPSSGPPASPNQAPPNGSARGSSTATRNGVGGFNDTRPTLGGTTLYGGRGVDNMNPNTKPAQGSVPFTGNPGLANTRPAQGSVQPVQTGPITNSYAQPPTGRVYNNLDPRGSFAPLQPNAGSLRPNSGYGISNGSRPTHMDARGIQRYN